jgi:hypothetical protein
MRATWKTTDVPRSSLKEGGDNIGSERRKPAPAQMPSAVIPVVTGKISVERCE